MTKRIQKPKSRIKSVTKSKRRNGKPKSGELKIAAEKIPVIDQSPETAPVAVHIPESPKTGFWRRVWNWFIEEI